LVKIDKAIYNRRKIVKTERQGTDDGGVRKFEGLMLVPQLKKGEHDKSKDEHPSLPFPELVIPVNADEEELHARLGKDKAHPRQNA
jgi:hypothetical protein